MQYARSNQPQLYYYTQIFGKLYILPLEKVNLYNKLRFGFHAGLGQLAQPKAPHLMRLDVT